MNFLKHFSSTFFKSTLFLCGLILFFTACQKEETVEPTIIESEISTNLDFAESSKIMAAALSNLITVSPNWEEVIKTRAIQAENGDNVFLYAFAKDMTVENTSLAEALAEQSSQSVNYFSKTIINDFPLISIAFNVPVQLKDAPLTIDINTVFYNFQNDDNYRADQEIPHYVDGVEKIRLYNEFNKRNDAFLVIKNNERIVLRDQNTGIILNDANFLKNYVDNNPSFKNFFYSSDALIGTLGNVEYRLNAEIGYTLTETINMEETSARCFRESWPHVRDGSTAVIYENDREGLFMGGPEIRQRMNRVQSNGSLMAFNSGRNYGGGNEGVEMVFNYNAFLLDLNTHGDAYGWAWWEEDGGSGDDRFTGSFSATVPGLGDISLSFDFAKNQDDNYGDMEVSRCMGAQWIDIGDIRWWGGPTHW